MEETLDLNFASVQKSYFDMYCIFLGLLDLFLGREGWGGITYPFKPLLKYSKNELTKRLNGVCRNRMLTVNGW